MKKKRGIIGGVIIESLSLLSISPTLLNRGKNKNRLIPKDENLTPQR